MSRASLPPHPNKLNLLLTEVKLKLLMQLGISDMPDTVFARDHLGVSAGSLSQWKNGDRFPSLPNCIKLSQHPLIGNRIWDATGIVPPWAEKEEEGKIQQLKLELASDTKLQYVLDHFPNLREEGKDIFVQLLREVLDGRGFQLVYNDEQGEKRLQPG